MNRIFYSFGIAFLSLALCAAVIYSSFLYGVSDVVVPKTPEGNTWSTIRLLEKSENFYDAEFTSFDPKTKTVSKNTPILVEFGRLGSFLYLASDGSQSGVLSQKSATGIIIGDTSGIVSLYDLFAEYTIFDKGGSFSVKQITNGSFYIGKEDDGKVALYAIDGVVRLTFLAQNEEMTSMILFPGSYIRFDPSRNRSLKGADLFRTILSLQADENEVFEFVNPRVNRGDDEDDTFINYRLKPETKILFRALSTIFRKKVENIDIQKRYALTGRYDSQDTSSLLINPSKKDNAKLRELQSLLARAVDTAGASSDLVKQIGKTYMDAKDLKMTNSNAKSIVEQFLLDGRFALYGGIANSNYQETYESIAQIIGIQKTSGQSKLLQSLSDIYSRNLFTQKRSANRIKIDTYGPTSLELDKTIKAQEIEQKDYFDIAIYAFNILKKTEESEKIISRATLEDNSTYTYLSVFFDAARLYIESIDDTEKKQQTVISFSRQFYDSIITTLSHSLYHHFTVSEDGALYLIPEFREGTKLKVSDELVQNINTLNALIDTIKPSIDGLWSASGSADIDTYSRIQRELLRIKGFQKMISADEYKDYVQAPYKVDLNEKIPLPLVNDKNTMIISVDPDVIAKAKNTKTLLSDPRMKEVQKIWPSAPSSTWVVDGDYIRIIKAPYTVSRTETKTSALDISALYKDDLLSDIIIFYGDYTIEVAGDPISVKSYYALMVDMKYYLTTIDDALQGSSTSGSMRIFPLKKRINIGDNLYPVKTE